MDWETTTQGGQQESRFGLPGIAGVQIRRVHFDPPIRFYREGRLVSGSDAVELLVQMTSEMPVLNVTPALFVGDVPVIHYDFAGPLLYRFRTWEIERLQRGARISIGWPGSVVRIATPFVFDPGAIPVA